MTIDDQIRAAADFEVWKLGRIQEGGDYSVDEYERHLRAQRAGDRLDSINEIVAPVIAAGPEGVTKEELWKLLRRTERLSDSKEETE
jgi:hypothetical protein